MAITESELNISNQSYTNKDFDSVYTELLTLAKDISYRYDPTASNESDPFIVLLKLLAFATDKVNYQIDKNILERFMPSATQDISMRDLTSRLGYNMHYYKGAETKVIYKYNFPADWSGGDITIPAFTSIISSSIDNSITYIPTADGRIDSGTGVSAAVSVIQGVYKTLSVLDSTTIQLENLDENNRIYFSETMVAQNGVFITGGSISELFATGWFRTDNLNSEQYGCPCYFFGYDSARGLPYLQFPDWISVIIGAGLTINYVVTQGSAGNVRARSLDSVDFTVADTAEYEASDIIVINTAAASNGDDPETIDEAYQGFKKTIGTFDTLVTCRDYANAIYNLLNDSNVNYVTNVQVADRRTDINYALNMVEYAGTETTESEALTSDITPYDLCMYPFKPVSMATVTALSSIEAYKESFKRLAQADFKPIQNAIANEKTLVHTYKTLADTDIYAIKNYYELNVIISTVSKVDTLEQASILTNVNGALAYNFYSRNVNYGYEIAFDELQKCIENADSRIKSVSLFEPIQTPKALLADETEVAISNTAGTAVSDWFRVVAIKNIVSGRVELFAYDEAFNYSFDKVRYNTDQTATDDGFEKINTATKVTTTANITIPAPTSPSTEEIYTLGANESVQFIAPNYVDYQIYPYGINYYLELYGDTSVTNQMSIVSWTDGVVTVKFSSETNPRTITAYRLTAGTVSVIAGDDYTDFLGYANSLFCFTVLTAASGTTYVYNYPTGSNNYIPKDSEYELGPNDKLIFEYTEDDMDKFDVFTSTTMIGGRYVNIIKPNFNMYTTKFREVHRAAYPSGETGTTYTNPADGVSHNYFMLSTNEEVATRQINSEVLSQPYKFYWVLQNTDNKIGWSAISGTTTYEYILKENEELFYTDLNMTGLQEFGSGTRLVITSNLYDSYKNVVCEKISDLSILTTDGLESFASYFKTFSLSSSDTFTIEEQQIITLTANDQLKNTSSASVAINNNTFNTISTANLQYKFETEESFESFPDLSSQSTSWRARGLLDINAGPELVQTLVNNQSVVFTYSSGTTESFTASATNTWSFQFDSLIQEYGGVDVALDITDIYYNVTHPKVYAYKLDSNVSAKVTTSDETNYCRVDFSNATTSSPVAVTIHLPQIETASESNIAKPVYVMCYTRGIAAAEGSEPAKTLAVSATRNGAYTAGTELFTPYNIDSLTTTGYMENGMIIFKTVGIKSITFTADSSDIALILSIPRVADSINPLLGLLTNDLAVSGTSNPKKLTDFEQKMVTYCGGYSGAFSKFYATSFIDTVKQLELSKTCKLTDAQAFYDTNNVANKWVIPQIDFDTNVTSITIARSSQK